MLQASVQDERSNIVPRESRSASQDVSNESPIAVLTLDSRRGEFVYNILVVRGQYASVSGMLLELVDREDISQFGIDFPCISDMVLARRDAV